MTRPAESFPRDIGVVFVAHGLSRFGTGLKGKTVRP